MQKIQFKRFWRKNRVLLTREQRKKEDQEWKKVLEDIARQTEGVEPIVATYYSFANSFITLLMSPMVQFYLLLSDTNGVHVTELPANYSIAPTNLQYYTIFSCIIMLFQVRGNGIGLQRKCALAALTFLGLASLPADRFGCVGHKHA